MIGGDDAFMIFIAIFWGTMLGSAGRYGPFDTAAAFFAPRGKDRRIMARRRLIVSTLLLNVLPLLYLVAGYLVLKGAEGVRALIGAAVMSLGIFGCIRVLHAVMATHKTRTYFFDENHWNEKLKGEREEEEHRFMAHFMPGVAYLAVYFVVGLLIARL